MNPQTQQFPNRLLPKSYLVEKIMGFKMLNHKVVFNVKWENYSEDENTWEPIENLKDCIVFKEFIADVFKDHKNKIINTNLELFQKDLNAMELDCKYRQFNILQNLESTTKDLDLKCLQIIYNVMIKAGYNPNEDFKQYYIEQFKISRLKVCLDRTTRSFQSKENNFLINVENNVDFDLPQPFKYITKNKIATSLVIKKKKQYECYCFNTCSGSNCCFNRMKTVYKIKDWKADHIIYECGDECSCDLSCINRKTQVKSSISLSLFKTSNNRGWGVKTNTNIQSNTYIFEYVGKIIQQSENYSKDQTYMYELISTQQKNNNYYIIDGKEYGNLSRFLNHSCDPNCTIWKVFECNSNSKLFKLCFFANRSIAPNEELTINYNGPDYGDGQIKRPIKSLKCLCGSGSKCTGYVFWES